MAPKPTIPLPEVLQVSCAVCPASHGVGQVTQSTAVVTTAGLPWPIGSSKPQQAHVPAANLSPVALQVRSGDVIRIDAETKTISAVNVSDQEWEQRRSSWQAPPYKATRGTLYKYIKNVTSASIGCVTDV